MSAQHQSGREGKQRVRIAISPKRLQSQLYRYAAAMVTVAIVVVAYTRLPVNPTTVALTFLLVVLGVASRWGLTLATTTAVVATLAFNYYFLPPIHTFTVAAKRSSGSIF